MANKISQRLAVVETKVEHIESDVGEIKADVKVLLKNNAMTKAKMGFWDRLYVLFIGALAGFFSRFI